MRALRQHETYLHHKDTRGREKEQGIENLGKMMTENFSNIVRRKVTIPGSTEGPDQDEPKKVHSKTH